MGWVKIRPGWGNFGSCLGLIQQCLFNFGYISSFWFICFLICPLCVCVCICAYTRYCTVVPQIMHHLSMRFQKYVVSPKQGHPICTYFFRSQWDMYCMYRYVLIRRPLSQVCLSLKQYFEAHLAIKVQQMQRLATLTSRDAPQLSTPGYKVSFLLYLYF